MPIEIACVGRTLCQADTVETYLKRELFWQHLTTDTKSARKNWPKNVKKKTSSKPSPSASWARMAKNLSRTAKRARPLWTCKLANKVRLLQASRLRFKTEQEPLHLFGTGLASTPKTGSGRFFYGSRGFSSGHTFLSNWGCAAAFG